MKKVLLVDDDKYTHELVRLFIKDKNYDVELYDAYTALEAFEEIRTGDYDIALVDQKIEVMQGTDVIRSLRHLKLKTAIYLFTGFEKDYVRFQSKDLEGFLAGIVEKGKMEEEFDKLFQKK